MNLFTIATTNRPELIDPAVLRPGRIDFSVACPLPTDSEAKNILQVICNRLDLRCSERFVLSGLSGAEIQSLASRAYTNCIKKGDPEDETSFNTEFEKEMQKSVFCTKNIQAAKSSSQIQIQE